MSIQKEKLRVDTINEMIYHLEALRDGTLSDLYEDLDSILDDDKSGDIELFIMKIHGKLLDQKIVIMHRMFCVEYDESSINMVVDREFPEVDVDRKYDILCEAEDYFVKASIMCSDVFELTPQQFIDDIVFDEYPKDCDSVIAEDTTRFMHAMLDRHNA